MMNFNKRQVGVKYSLLYLLCLLMLFSVNIQAQNSIATGQVISEDDDMPIPGVSVVIEGTTIGTITDMDGNYSIKAKIGQSLQFSFVGMKNLTVKLKSFKQNVTMESEFIGLDEVVAIGYGVQKKKEVTGAVTQVKSEVLEKFTTSDVSAALQGQVAGVNITASSGEPGSSSVINIRGIASLSGDNTPLFVVDGIPQDEDPRLSPNEIESIDILKDAASCAVYGTRGAAGVIIITTKQGKAGTTKITAEGSYGIQHITSGTELMNASDQIYFEMSRKHQLNTVGEQKSLLTNRLISLAHETDMIPEVIIDNAKVQNYNLNISGGTKELSYSVVGGFYDQEGIILNSRFKRYNSRISTNLNKGKWKIATSLSASLEKNNKSGNFFTYGLRYLPYQRPLTADSNGDAIEENDWKGSALLNMLKNKNNNTRDKFSGSVSATYSVFKGLNFITKVGAGISNSNSLVFKPQVLTLDLVEEETRYDPTKSESSVTQSRSTSLSWEGTLNYTKKFGKHTVTALASYSIEEYTYGGIKGGRQGIYNNNFELINSGTVNEQIESLSHYNRKLIGTLGRVQYNYKSRYLLSGSLRRDGSSKFAPEYRWGTFPSAMVGWNVADERFWKPIKKVMNGFKLRASYGTTGNERPGGAYEWDAIIRQEYNYAFATSGDSDNYQLGNTQIEYANAQKQWETSVQTNLGVDLGLFKNKITVAVDYYDTQKEDMLFPVRMPGSIGAGTKYNMTLNVGNMTNKGVEVAVRFREQLGLLKFDMSGTFSKNENTVTKMFGESDMIYNTAQLIGGSPASVVTVIAEGYEAGAFFLHETDGVINTDEELAAYKKINPNAEMGYLKYVDTNDDGSITIEDRTYHGSGLPDYELGLNFNLGYKNWDFNMHWYGSFGAEVLNGSKAYAYYEGRHKDLLYMYSDANPDSNIPLYLNAGKSDPNMAGNTDLWVEDGSFVRLKNITLGYTMPKSLTSKVGVGNLRFYVSAQNPITITKYEGFDPEIGGSNVSTRGMDKGNYPVSSKYLVGMKLGF